MILIRIGKCEDGSCEDLEGEHCQLWLFERALLCWYCWRRRLGIREKQEDSAA